MDCLNIPEALEWIRQASRDGRARRIGVVNANKLFLMSRDARLKAIVQESDLVVPEWAVVWGAGRLGLSKVSHSGGFLLSKALHSLCCGNRVADVSFSAEPPRWSKPWFGA